MTALRTLTKPQSDAAFAAARCIGNIHDPVARAMFRDARAALAALLPPDADVTGIIDEAIRWLGRDFMAAVLADLPIAA